MVSNSADCSLPISTKTADNGSDAANQLAELDDQHAAGPHGSNDQDRDEAYRSDESEDTDEDDTWNSDAQEGTASTGVPTVRRGTKQHVGELLRVALVVHCALISSTLGTDANWWQRGYFVAIRGCRDSLRRSSRVYNISSR